MSEPPPPFPAVPVPLKHEMGVRLSALCISMTQENIGTSRNEVERSALDTDEELSIFIFKIQNVCDHQTPNSCTHKSATTVEKCVDICK